MIETLMRLQKTSMGGDEKLIIKFMWPNGLKLIAARLTIHLNGRPFLAMGGHFGGHSHAILNKYTLFNVALLKFHHSSVDAWSWFLVGCTGTTGLQIAIAYHVLAIVGTYGLSQDL